MAHHRILIADDNRDTAESFALLLSFEGHEVICARDGAEALKLFHEKKPDTALLDISMPVLDGYEVARRIRAQEGDDSVLLLAMSGWAREGDIERSMEAGFDHHLVKPATLLDITRLIDAG
jgi:two-component system, sensor histidine kinase